METSVGNDGLFASFNLTFVFCLPPHTPLSVPGEGLCPLEVSISPCSISSSYCNSTVVKELVILLLCLHKIPAVKPKVAKRRQTGKKG